MRDKISLYLLVAVADLLDPTLESFFEFNTYKLENCTWLRTQLIRDVYEHIKKMEWKIKSSFLTKKKRANSINCGHL